LASSGQIEIVFGQSAPMVMIGLLLSQFENSREATDRIEAIRSGLQKLGHVEGQDDRLDIRYGRGSSDLIRAQGQRGYVR
jgi:hypothetical protein